MSVLEFLVKHFKLSGRHGINCVCNNNRLTTKTCFDNASLGIHDAATLAFRGAARGGHLSVIKFIVNSFQLTTEDVRGDDNDALRWAARCGHLDVLIYLIDTFKLTTIDARSGSNYALRWAAQNGHIAALQYLVSYFGLTNEDARAEQNHALRMAAKNGHVHVLRYLVDHFKLTDYDVEARNNMHSVAFMAAQNGHIAVFTYILGRFEALYDCYLAMMDLLAWIAALNGKARLFHFLVQTFKLQEKDNKAGFDTSRILKETATHGHVNVMHCLVTNFGLAILDKPVVHYLLHTSVFDRRDFLVIKQGESLFCQAAENGNVWVLQFLINTMRLSKNNADVVIKSAFWEAVYRSRVCVLRFLVEVLDFCAKDASPFANVLLQKEKLIRVNKATFNYLNDTFHKIPISRVLAMTPWEY